MPVEDVPTGSRRASPPADEALGRPAATPRGGWRDRVRSKPGIGQCYRAAVFVAGLLFIVLGIGLAVLPGPLTIPPVLLGLWIWSTEFRFAQKLFANFRRKARDAWAHAKAHPVSSAAITVGGLAAAAVAVWAVSHFELVERGREAAGL
jgi:uncharacterized membrane protein YbaN (DUF454 family)